MDLQQVPRSKTRLANSLNHAGSVTCRPNKSANFLPFSSPFLNQALMPSADDKSPPKDWWSYHAMFRGGVSGLIVLRSLRQEIRHHFCSLHNATNSSIQHASFQSRSGESISRISIHSRIHISIYSNKKSPTTCKSSRRGKSPSRSNSTRIRRKRHQVSEPYPGQLYLNQTCHIISLTISIFFFILNIQWRQRKP